MRFPNSDRLLLLLSLCCLVGCSGPTRDADFVKAANDNNLKKMGSAYQLYAARFGYTGPKSKEDLLNFLKTNETIEKNLKLMEIDRGSIENYFISENDGKEFKFRWGVFIDPDSERSKEPLVFEQEGKEGVRLVILSNRKILEVKDDAKYNELFAGKVDSEEAKSDLEKEEESDIELED